MGNLCSWSCFLLRIALFLCFFQRQTPKMENKMKPPIPTETYTAAPRPGRRTCTIPSNAGQIMRRKKRKNGFKEAEKTPARRLNLTRGRIAKKFAVEVVIANVGFSSNTLFLTVYPTTSCLVQLSRTFLCRAAGAGGEVFTGDCTQRCIYGIGNRKRSE